MSEIAHVQNPVSAYAVSRGWLAWKMKIEGRNGCPDKWFFKDGRLIIVEFKDEGKPRQPQQVRRARELEAAGFEVHVIDNYEDGCALFD